MRWIGCVCSEKIRRDFVARTFALIAPVHPVLQRVSCSYETITNAPVHYETHQNMSFGSNGVDQVFWLRKITTRLRGTNFCINCTSSVCFGVFHSISVHLGSFRNCMKLVAKHTELVQLMQMFVPRSHVIIFRNERTPLDPKLMFRCVSQYFGAFGIVS